ncbi:MAG: hypothetical protein IPH44_36840 [Myxococcales bacterium]|jgi:hypothetical protein|nr:hypothetical protein [Myxococcales bacterium]MBP6842729.1 hypothetical protein [Kofleriaceae bacterium]
MPIRSLFLGIALSLAAACSDPAPAIDAGVDAAIDAPAVGPTRVELGGGGRVSGGTLTADVQLGVPIAQHPTTGGTLTATTATPIAR